MRVAIVNYEMGNLGSLRNMLRKLGHDVQITSDPALLEKATHLVLPGVGNFAKGMANLRRLGLIEPLTRKVLDGGTPTLGICLGMQLLARHSEEGDCEGLGWIDARVVRFRPDRPAPRPLRIPHMGWNFLDLVAPSPLFDSLESESRFYFTHSYHYSDTAPAAVLATADYGGPFVAAVRRDNLYGVQFHPEKSHRFGMRVIEKFLELRA